MKVILLKLAKVLIKIEDIILTPVDLAVILIGKIAFRNDKVKLADLYTNCLWLFKGWYCRLNDVSKSDVRNVITFMTTNQFNKSRLY